VPQHHYDQHKDQKLSIYPTFHATLTGKFVGQFFM